MFVAAKNISIVAVERRLLFNLDPRSRFSTVNPVQRANLSRVMLEFTDRTIKRNREYVFEEQLADLINEISG